VAFWLRSEERRVAARARRVRSDLNALRQARVRLARAVRRELGRPKALLACFAAGLGFGWLRAGRRRELAGEAVDRPQTGRLAQVTAAVLAGARLYEQLRRTAALVERRGRAGRPPPAATGGESSTARWDDAAEVGPQHDAARRRHEDGE